MRKLLLLPTLIALTGCSNIMGKSYHEDYGDYEGNRAKASARCTELGYLAGSPEFYSCVTKEYTKIKGGR